MNKRCFMCGDVKPLTEFNVSRRNRDGRQSACKRCLAAYRRTPEEQERRKLWNKATPVPTGVEISDISGESFWNRVEKTDGCWIWNGGRNELGYGILRNWKVHRLVYFWLVGEVPDGFGVCHHCDNPPCCRPSHLFLGDDEANMADMVRKGRSTVGELNPSHVLSAEMVKAIRANPPSRYGSFVQLVRELGISHSALRKVLNGETWKACV